eukprot:CAMPEP_0172455494 /NCGR_PEP_ID=MMETSP1065-20121228/12093_1 /TAXON_ID=265537 /ORGANISM="Amphiprora paludosa, Strain CCMP125" /LENGTH=305 /DNA_ID=CAMNT_0013207955 /DNA_START=100 /DNA_END=1017 /DNA_ORIENTATION=+
MTMMNQQQQEAEQDSNNRQIVSGPQESSFLVVKAMSGTKDEKDHHYRSPTNALVDMVVSCHTSSLARLDLEQSVGDYCVPLVLNSQNHSFGCGEDVPLKKPSGEEEEDHPPLDQVTVTTSSESATSHYEDREDASDCSSLSCDLPESLSPPPRSIFQDYWQSEGLDTSPFRRCVPISTPPHLRGVTLRALTRDEQVLRQEAAAVASPMRLKRSSRRTIFGSAATSQGPTMLPHGNDPTVFRKTQSAPALQRRSALRSGRYSSNRPGEESSHSMARSVSFQNHVHVTVFHPSPEQYAADGWSNWFA